MTQRRRGQNKGHSLWEACVGTAVGFFLALGLQDRLHVALGLKVSHADNLIIVGVLTVVSVVRGYYVRRFFNWLHSRADRPTEEK